MLSNITKVFQSKIKVNNSIISLGQPKKITVFGDENWDKVAEIAYDDLDHESFLRALDGDSYYNPSTKQDTLRRSSVHMSE
jgi:hypothetical protein